LSYEGRVRGFVLGGLEAVAVDTVEVVDKVEVLVFAVVLDRVSVRRARSSIALKD
jgi:hypothetical protein